MFKHGTEPLPKTGAHVVLRRLASMDLAAFQDYRRDDVGKYQGWSVMSDAVAMEFLLHMQRQVLGIDGQWIQLGIAYRQGNHLIGDIGLCLQEGDERSAEIGFTLSPAYQRKGFATEALQLVLSLLFDDLGVTRVEATTDARNASAMQLLSRNGFTLVETLETLFRGEPCTEHRHVIELMHWRSA